SSLRHSSSGSLALMINPPSKPISTRDSAMRDLLVGWLDELQQHAVHAVRMDERDAEPEQPGTRHRVDQLGAGRRGVSQRTLDVRHAKRDVMHPGAAVGKELAHGAVRGKR